MSATILSSLLLEDYRREIIGLTPIGRATLEALALNRQGMVNLRHLLMMAGLHPPEE